MAIMIARFLSEVLSGLANLRGHHAGESAYGFQTVSFFKRALFTSSLESTALA